MIARAVTAGMYLSAVVWGALALRYSESRLLWAMCGCILTAVVVDLTADRMQSRDRVWQATREATSQAWAEFNALGLRACAAGPDELAKIRARQAQLLRILGLAHIADHMDRQIEGRTTR